jgi:hypothetical protein
MAQPLGDRPGDHFIGIGLKKRPGRLKIIRVAHRFPIIFQQIIKLQRYGRLPYGAVGAEGFLGTGYKKRKAGHQKSVSLNWFYWFDWFNWFAKSPKDIVIPQAEVSNAIISENFAIVSNEFNQRNQLNQSNNLSFFKLFNLF